MPNSPLPFFLYFILFISLHSAKTITQTSDAFEIKLKLIEYIDANTKEHTLIEANNTSPVINLSRNYNHIFVSLEDDPSIQYTYKVTGESFLSQWKNTGSEIHLIGLSRLDHNINLEIIVDPKIVQKAVYLPCMMLQPIVENAIVHGIIPKQDTGAIKIKLDLDDEMLRITVTDNGIGREAAAAQKEGYAKYKSHATQIMRDRIDIFNYYNKRKLFFEMIDLHNDDGTPSGTKVILHAPLDLKTRN